MTKKQQHGFTILELLIATTVFAVILLITVTAIIQISKLYFKGVTTNKVQEATRSISDQISQKLQFSEERPQTGTGTISGLTIQSYCFGTTRYSYALNMQVTGSLPSGNVDTANHQLKHALWEDQFVGPCTPADLSLDDPTGGGPGNTGRDLLGQGMRLSAFDISCKDIFPSPPDVCTMQVGVIYGKDDLLAPPVPPATIPDHCQTILGEQWCGSAKLLTTVQPRL